MLCVRNDRRFLLFYCIMNSTEISTAMLHIYDEYMQHSDLSSLVMFLLSFVVLKFYHIYVNAQVEPFNYDDVWPEPYIPLRQRFGTESNNIGMTCKEDHADGQINRKNGSRHKDDEEKYRSSLEKVRDWDDSDNSKIGGF